MKPIKFEEQNVIYAENQKEYLPLPAKKNENGDVITCWELSPEEVKEVTETGKIWFKIATFNQPLQPIFSSILKHEVLGIEPENKINPEITKEYLELDKISLMMVLKEVGYEREKQHDKWGEQNRNPLEWLGILAEEFGEVSREAVDYYFENGTEFVVDETKEMIQSERLSRYRAELIQVAAVAVQAIECLDRNKTLKNGG